MEESAKNFPVLEPRLLYNISSPSLFNTTPPAALRIASPALISHLFIVCNLGYISPFPSANLQNFKEDE